MIGEVLAGSPSWMWMRAYTHSEAVDGCSLMFELVVELKGWVGIWSGELTMKRTSRAARVVPTISATSTHLALIDDAFRPRPVTLVAILALACRCLS